MLYHSFYFNKPIYIIAIFPCNENGKHNINLLQRSHAYNSLHRAHNKYPHNKLHVVLLLYVNMYTLMDLPRFDTRSEEHTSELQSRFDIVCRLLLEKKNI